jgi:very-short-patch-repair endonuclease
MKHLVQSREAEAVVATIGAERRGIVPAALAREAGIAHDDLARLRRRGLLVNVGRGVDRLRDRPFDWASQCQACLDLAGPGSVLGPRPSARLHECYGYRRDDRIEVYRPKGSDHRLPVGRVIETRWLPPSHVTEIEGLPALTLARTFFGLCADPDPGFSYRHPAHHRKMRRVYNDALGRRGLTFAKQAAVLAVTARQGRRGTAMVRAILLEFPPEHRPTKSDTEFLFLELLETYGIRVGQRQETISGPDGFIGQVDFSWREAMLVVEIDSTWHDGPIDIIDDAVRDERLRAAGWTVLRYRYRDLVARPVAVARELAVATRPRAER